MKHISVKGKLFTVDDEDFVLVSGYNWHLDTFGYPRWLDNRNKKMIAMHRLIMQCPDGLVVDHIDGDIRNNQRHNLRICTLSQNLYNSKKREFTTSRYKGVSWNKRDNRWHAKICKDKKVYFLGNFTDEEAAAVAYNEKAAELFGEYARLNKTRTKE